MIAYLKSLFVTQTGKDTSIIFTGTLINVVVGGLFFILAPRLLGPQSYGLFAVVMSTGVMAVNFANFGIDTGILRFIKEGQKETNDKILKLAFKAYIAIGIAVFIFGLIFSQALADILGQGQIASLLKVAFGTTIFILLTNFATAVLQTQKKFKEASIVNISSNTARLLVLAAASYFATINLTSLTLIFFGVTIISAAVGKLLVPLDFLKAKEEKLHFKDFFSFNFWIAAALAISAIPFDNYILLKTAGPAATGIFAAPFKLLSTSYQFAGAFSRVLAPRFSSFDTNKKAVDFSKKAAPFVVAVSAALIATGFFARPIVNVILGQDYLEAAQVFRILSPGMAFFFAGTIPMAIILYYFGKSKVAFYITVCHYAAYVLLLLALTPKYSYSGAAAAFTLSEAATFAMLVAYVFSKLNKNHVS